MTRRSVAVAPFLVLAMAGTVLGFNEPEGFRGLPWGATEEQMRSAVSIERACVDLRPDQRWIADRSCPAILDLAGIGVQAEYRFRAGSFTSVILRFPSKDFERIAEIFSERYGEPTNRTTDHLAWVGRKASVALYRRVDKVPSVGWARLTTNEDMHESERIRNEQTKGAAKGL
jgi:hypothetical protein